MAKYQASNRTFDIPEEGEIFIGKEDPRFVYKRVGEKVYHTWAKDVPLTNLPVRGIADFTGVLGAGKFENWQSPSFFTQGVITPGQDLSAMEQVRRAQGLPPGSPIPGETVGANIVAQPGIAPQSTFSVVAQGIADVQRRIDEISGKPLSAASTASSPTPPYVPPAQVPTLSTAAITGSALGTGVGSDVKLSPEQQKVQTDTEKLYDLITQKATKPAYEIEQKKIQDVSEKQDFIDDLSTQLTDLDFQAKAIPMQIQEQFKGTGATTAGVAPIEAAALRNNAIQALGLSAQLAAAQGKLATAERRVKDAVSAKYAPIEAEIDAKLANLKLAQASPAYTLAEKKQAAELEAQITAQKDALNVTKKDAEDVGKALNEAISNGLTDRKIMNDITSSKTGEEAMMKVASYGYGVKKGAGDIITQIQTLNYLNTIEDNLRINPATVAYNQLVNFGVPTILNTYYSGQSDSVSDTVLMRALAKVTDPTTGVREEEYRTFETAVGALNRVYVAPKGWFGEGRLTNKGRSAMIREIENRFNQVQGEYQNQYQYYQNQAKKVGGTIPPIVNPKINTIANDEQIFDSVIGGTDVSTGISTPSVSDSGGYWTKLFNSILGR